MTPWVSPGTIGRIVWFAAKAVAATIQAYDLAALGKKEIDPPSVLPVALKAAQEPVHEQNWCSRPDHLIVDRHTC